MNLRIAWIIQGQPKSAWSYFMQIRLFTKYLNGHGIEACVINTSSQKDYKEMSRAIGQHKTDVVLNLGDVHYLNLAEKTGVPVVSVVTNGTGVVGISGRFPLTFFACTTKYAQKLFKKAKVEPTSYFPHGFDPEIFYPDSRKKARKRLGWTHDEPTVLMLGTNYNVSPLETHNSPGVDRKNWVGGLQAFSKLIKVRPEVKLYIHTNAYGAVDIPYWIEKLKIKDSVILADPSSNKETGYESTTNNSSQVHVADLYRAANVLLFPSLGESFGVPLIEAQACGIPVITTDAGPMTELAISGVAVHSSPHPAFPGWGIPDKSALTNNLLKWIDIDSPKEISQKIQRYSGDNIIKNHLLKILNNAKN